MNPNNTLPPGQHEVKDWPILTAGRGPQNAADWTLTIDGLVENPVVLTWDQIVAMATDEQNSDFHCVTTWSLLNTKWTGISWKKIEELVKPKPEATYVLQYSNDSVSYTTGTLLSELQKPNVLVGYKHNDEPIPMEHGGPMRLIIPHLYAYKSAKWLNRLEFLPAQKLGFWEERGYSEQADPLKEQRYTEDDE